MRYFFLFALSVTSTFLLASEGSFAQEKLPPPLQGDLKVLEFTGPEKGWPPDVAGAEKIEILPLKFSPNSITSAFEARISEIASSSDLAQKALGERYSFIEVNAAETPKDGDGEKIQALEQSPVKAIFYSYSRNVAVQATVRAGEVLQVQDLDGYQPPESQEEIMRAAKLAAEIPAIKDIQSAYEFRGLLTEAGEGQAGAGHRLIYVSYQKPGTANVEYFALVDLTDNIVLDSGKAAGLQ
jgi:hypothetical protein